MTSRVPTIAIIQFPGSNCERETTLAVQRTGMYAVDFLWNQSPEQLDTYDGFILVGGFSYEDRGRAGLIASLDPLLAILEKQALLGKPILGICNGAQILVESGLVPGLPNRQIAMALTTNKRVQDGTVLDTGYYNEWIYLKHGSQQPLRMPVAHAEGRFIIPPALLTELKQAGAIVYQYCDASGNIHDEFPTNPNGSIENIAAISNVQGNVLAMMPHPERTPDADSIFISMRNAIEHQKPFKPYSFKYHPEKSTAKKIDFLNDSGFIINTIITDNTAVSLESAVNAQGFSISLKRFIHWEMAINNVEERTRILESGELLNPKKEYILEEPLPASAQHLYFLIRERDAFLAAKKMRLFKTHYDCHALSDLKHGILWQIDCKNHSKEEIKRYFIENAILFNPYAHECYEYHV